MAKFESFRQVISWNYEPLFWRKSDKKKNQFSDLCFSTLFLSRFYILKSCFVFYLWVYSLDQRCWKQTIMSVFNVYVYIVFCIIILWAGRIVYVIMYIIIHILSLIENICVGIYSRENFYKQQQWQSDTCSELKKIPRTTIFFLHSDLIQHYVHYELFLDLYSTHISSQCQILNT